MYTKIKIFIKKERKNNIKHTFLSVLLQDLKLLTMTYQLSCRCHLIRVLNFTSPKQGIASLLSKYQTKYFPVELYGYFILSRTHFWQFLAKMSSLDKDWTSDLRCTVSTLYQLFYIERLRIIAHLIACLPCQTLPINVPRLPDIELTCSLIIIEQKQISRLSIKQNANVSQY